MKKIVNYIAVFFLGVFLFLSFFRPVESGDIWWHLATGEWIVENAQIPRDDIFSFTDQAVNGMSPQWLGSTIYFGVYRAAGFPGLKLFRVAVFLSIIAVFAIYAKEKIPFPLLLGIILLMVPGLSKRCLLRPFTFNFIFIQWLLILLFYYKKTKNRKCLLLIPFLGIAWSNLHLGAFVYGLPILSIFFLSAVIDYFTGCYFACSKLKKTRLMHRVFELALTMFCYLACFMINPYGLEGLLYPFKAILSPEFINFYKLNKVIAELNPPLYLLHLSGFWVLLFIIADCAALYLCKKHKFILTLLFAFGLFIMSRGTRGVPFFVIISAYLCFELFRQEHLQKKLTASLLWQKSSRLLVLTLIMFMGIQSARLINTKIFVHKQLIREATLDQAVDNPRTAVQLLERYKMQGPMINDDKYGNYVIFFLYPAIKPFIDSRQYNQELFFEYVNIASNPKEFFLAAEKKYHFKIAMFDSRLASHKKLIPFVNALDTWQLIFIDGTTLVFVKRNSFDLPQKLENFEDKLRNVRIPEETKKRFIAQLLKPPRRKPFNIFQPRLKYIDLLEEGLILNELGYSEASIERFIQSFLVDERLTRRVVKLQPSR